MKKQKKYLTSTEQYERWKMAFRKEMERVLKEIFEKKFITASLYVRDVDKWNVWFVVRGIPRGEVLQSKLKPFLDFCEEIKFGGITCKIAANTKEELNAILGYLRIVV